MEAVSAAAVSPDTAFSFNDALTSNFPTGGLDTAALDGLTGANGLRKASAVGGCRFPAAEQRGSGIAMETAEVEAIGERGIGGSVVVLE